MNFSYSKDGITVAAMIDTSHPKQNGCYPVRIRVTYARQRRYYSTGKDLTPEEWEALPTTKVHTLISTRKDIENSYNIVRDMVEDLAMSGAFSFDNLNKRLKRGGGVTLNAAFKAKIDDLRKQERVGSIMSYCKAWNGSPGITFQWLPYQRIGCGVMNHSYLERGKAARQSESICDTCGRS